MSLRGDADFVEQLLGHFINHIDGETGGGGKDDAMEQQEPTPFSLPSIGLLLILHVLYRHSGRKRRVFNRYDSDDDEQGREGIQSNLLGPWLLGRLKVLAEQPQFLGYFCLGKADRPLDIMSPVILAYD